MSEAPEPSQRVIQAELGEMTELESMCPECQKNGTTRLMITNIPHFREIIVSSFECPHCGEKNNEIQFGGQFGPKRSRFELEVRNKKDMNRQVVKSEWATITIPELDLEVPPQTQKGMLNTVEGVLQQTIDGLQMEQPVRKAMEPELYEKVEAFCKKVAEYQTGEKAFHFFLDDPAGNSHIEPYYDYYHPTIDNQLVHYERERTEIDRQLLGLSIDYNSQRTEQEQKQVDEGEIDIVEMDTICSACRKPGKFNIHKCDIPHFKDTVIMAFRCEFCGYKTNEIKTGGEVSPHGVRIKLEVKTPSDLSRDLLKSDTASLSIPAIDLELAPGTLGGFFSTVEGTINQIKEQLQSLPNVEFLVGDSGGVNTEQQRQENALQMFVKKLDNLMKVEMPFTIILDDPLGNIYIQNPRMHLDPPNNVDPQLSVETYTRTWEQDEELGFHDMKV